MGAEWEAHFVRECSLEAKIRLLGYSLDAVNIGSYNNLVTYGSLIVHPTASE